MNERTSSLLKMRPTIVAVKEIPGTSGEELFQNNTLRPVIKLQDELLIAAFLNYVDKHKGIFYDLSLEKRLQYIDTCIHKDMKFRNSLKGMIIGQFTIEEYKTYILHSSALNKRMMNLVIGCLKDQIQLLRRPHALIDAV